MRLPAAEPTSPDAVGAWIEAANASVDRFAHVRRASDEHREQHGPECSVYPSGSGPTLGVLAAATAAKRILELGCGLGYSALWLAFGAGPEAHVETIEEDPEHVGLARAQFREEGFAARVTVHEGRGASVLPRTAGPYDLVFCDADPAEYEEDLEHFLRVLRPGGLLVTSNLFLGVYVPDLPGLERAAAYRRRIVEDERLETAFLADGTALSVARVRGG